MTAVLKNWRAALTPTRFWHRTSLALFGGILLGLAHINAELYLISWVALLPLLIATHKLNLKQTYFLGAVYGLGLYTVGAFWIVDFLYLFKSYEGGQNYLFSSLFWIYCAQMPACLALTYQWLKQKSPIPDTLLFPCVTVFYFACFPVLFSAQLGETQSQFTSALQPIEFFGVYGLDFVIALFTITAFKWVCGTHQAHQVMTLFTVLIAWFGYGVISNQQWESTMNTWDTLPIGFVQPNEVPDIKTNKVVPGYSRTYPPEMDMTERLTEAGAKLIVWPEAKYKGYINNQFVQDAYLHNVKSLNVDLIFQDMEDFEISVNNENIPRQYNSAVMIDKNGIEQPLYRKQKRVAFGEYVPFISDIPVLRTWIEQFFGKFLNEIAKGPGPVTFTSGAMKFIPLICYETMFPDFVANAIPSNPQGAVLVGLSSNGWFGTSIQPYQHIYSASLRAVENRMPMIHALNNGPSVVVLPNGRISFMSDYHQAGGYITHMPYSENSGGSFFSRHPMLLLYFVYSVLVLSVLLKIKPLESRLKASLQNNNN